MKTPDDPIDEILRELIIGWRRKHGFALGESTAKAKAAIEAYCTRRMEQTVNEISKQLPWPKDIFGEVGYDDWPKIHEFATKELGYPIDRISGTLMRVGWLNFERMIKDRIKELEGANGGDT